MCKPSYQMIHEHSCLGLMARFNELLILRSNQSHASRFICCIHGSHVKCVLCCAESVAERSEAVNSKLQLRRDQIEELSQVKNLLTKLQAVFDLPRRLRTALNRGALDIAADAYADAAPLLKRYGHKVCKLAMSLGWLLIDTLCSLKLFYNHNCVMLTMSPSSGRAYSEESTAMHF